MTYLGSGNHPKTEKFFSRYYKCTYQLLEVYNTITNYDIEHLPKNNLGFVLSNKVILCNQHIARLFYSTNIFGKKYLILRLSTQSTLH